MLICPVTKKCEFIVPVAKTPTLLSSHRAVATFEATEAAASVVFRTVASVKAITSTSQILHLTATIILP